MKIIFACIHNAGRSQMAASFFNLLADKTRAHALSAGTQPAACVHPIVVEVMREVGVDLSNAQPQKLTTELAQNADWLITMGCGDECPVVPNVRRDDWPLRDPKGQSIDSVRLIRDDIRSRVVAFLMKEKWLHEA